MLQQQRIEQLIAITVSIGVAEAQGASLSLAALLARADQALYVSKAGGRNRVVVAEPDM